MINMKLEWSTRINWQRWNISRKPHVGDRLLPLNSA